MANGQGGPFMPYAVEVVIGVNNTVKWTNNDPNALFHTVTSNVAGLFSSEDIYPGGTFTCTFTVAGTYYYHCVYHAPMVGVIIVKSP